MMLFKSQAQSVSDLTKLLMTGPIRTHIVAWVAFVWGLLIFMPLGVNYLLFLLVVLAVILQGDGRLRWQRLGHGAMRMSLMTFGAWTLVVLALQGTWYAETPSNLWHGFRILLTLAVALSLSPLESRAALMGFFVACFLTIALIMGYHLHLFHAQEFWVHLTISGTNKTIGASILFSLLTGVLFAVLIHAKGASRWTLAAVLLLVLTIIAFGMAKRTAMLGSLCAILVVLFHHWRDQKIRLAAGLASVVLLAIAAVSLSDALQTKFFQGIAELEGALAGKVSHESWNVRIQMARHTLDMIAEHPWTGWGIGSWNEQWRLRTSPEMAGYNMPHNDALWMGAQAGVLGGLSWLLLMTSGWSVAWKNRSWVGSAATAGICVATFSALINNATRDATIGLPMLWMMGVLVSLAKMPEPRP